MQDILQPSPQDFEGLGKSKIHQVKLHVDTSVKPVAIPSRPVPYHLKARVTKEIEKIYDQTRRNQGATSFRTCSMDLKRSDNPRGS